MTNEGAFNIDIGGVPFVKKNIFVTFGRVMAIKWSNLEMAKFEFLAITLLKVAKIIFFQNRTPPNF